jgi:hypothetical protein
MRNVFLVCFCLLFALPAAALEIAGVSVPESIKTDDGVTLSLNGVGIRTKLFFDIYIAQLYLEKPAAEAKDVLAADSHKRMAMHFLYKNVEKAKLVEAWNEGFLGNTSPEQLAELKGRIDQFNAMFTDVKKGDVIILDYVPGSGTKVTVAGVEKGVIPGKDFNDAMLLIWLGESPVSKDLKAKLLGSGK